MLIHNYYILVVFLCLIFLIIYYYINPDSSPFSKAGGRNPISNFLKILRHGQVEKEKSAVELNIFKKAALYLTDGGRGKKRMALVAFIIILFYLLGFVADISDSSQIFHSIFGGEEQNISHNQTNKSLTNSNGQNIIVNEEVKENTAEVSNNSKTDNPNGAKNELLTIVNAHEAKWLFVIFFLAVLFLSILDGYSFFSAKLRHIDLKEVISGVGVMGTFIGVFLGLLHFDVNDVNKSIPTLINGLKVAFFSSIVGLGASISLLLFQRVIPDKNINEGRKSE